MDEKFFDKKEAMFLGLVQSFVTNGLIQLGKQKNPLSGKTEVNLRQAQYSIEMLDMIKEKTEGNLSEKEGSVIKKTISDLKLAFVGMSENK